MMGTDVTVAHGPDVATASFKRVFSAAHRIWNDRSKCRNVHGHNYRCLVIVQVPSAMLTPEGFTIPFGEIKRIVDNLDHKILLHVEDPLAIKFEDLGTAIVWMHLMPSTENVAQTLANEIKKALGHGIVHVELHETDNIMAEAWA